MFSQESIKNLGERGAFISDLARMAGGGASLMNGISRSLREEIKSRVEDFASRLNLVPREDFESVQAGLDHALREIENLKARIKKLETGKSTKKTASAAPARKKKGK
ncbi:MAG: accessory factor UbiK family protein [Alphaproteobacteria bacterium]|nr:accessory factor UbiK family protein [Alphaproteobacteria bacterium]